MFIFSSSLLLPHEIGILLALSVSRLRFPTTHIKFKYPTILFVGTSTSRLGMRDDAQVLLSLCQSYDSFLVYDGLFVYLCLTLLLQLTQ